MKYHGVKKLHIIQALGGAFKLLETPNPDSPTAAAIARFKEKDLATGRSVMDDLRAAVDQDSFARILKESGLQQFTHDVSASLRCHAHLDTGFYGRVVYKTLTAANLSSAILSAVPQADKKIVRENEVLAALNYAKAAARKSAFAIACRICFKPRRITEYRKDAKEILSLLRAPNGEMAAQEKLSSFGDLPLYHLSFYLAYLAGHDPKGRAIEGRTPSERPQQSYGKPGF